MIEHWERTVVNGIGDNVQAKEIVLHKRGADALGMAMRRNPKMPACNRIELVTMEAFTQIREDGTRRTREEITRDDRQGEEYEW